MRRKQSGLKLPVRKHDREGQPQQNHRDDKFEDGVLEQLRRKLSTSSLLEGNLYLQKKEGQRVHLKSRGGGSFLVLEEGRFPHRKQRQRKPLIRKGKKKGLEGRSVREQTRWSSGSGCFLVVERGGKL